MGPGPAAARVGAARGTEPASVAACAAALCPTDAVFEGTVATRQNSRVHRLRCGGHLVAVKEYPPALGGDHAAREFRVLRTLWDRSRDSGEAPLVPQPLLLCTEQDAYAMRWVEGRPLTVHLLDGRAADAAQAGALAGAWLQRFHALEREPSRAHDFAARLPYLHELRRVRADDALLARAVAALERHAGAAAACATPVSWIHGDMKSDNLLVSADGMVGLDVQAVDRNTVVYDLAPFLNHLRLLRWSPRGALARGRLARAASGFLDRYESQTRAWRAPIAWLQAYLLVQQLVPDRARGLRARVRELSVRATLRAVLRELSAALAAS